MRRKATITEREAKALAALTAPVIDDDHPVRSLVPAAEGWHLGRDLALKLKIGNNNTAKYYAPLIEKKFLETKRPAYLDARNRPADLLAFRLKRDVSTWRRVYKSVAMDVPVMSAYTLSTINRIADDLVKRYPGHKSNITPAKKKLLHDPRALDEASAVLLMETYFPMYGMKEILPKDVPRYWMTHDENTPPVAITIFDVIEVLKKEGGQQQLRTKK